MIAEKLGSGTLDVVRICWSQPSLLELPRAALQSKFRESERMGNAPAFLDGDDAGREGFYHYSY